MKEFRPDHLYIEPSGVASPSGVIDALDTLNISPVLVVGIVDATEFVEFHESEMYGAFFEDQIINSDIILVNKTDLVDNEKTGRTVSLLGNMNTRAVLIPTVNAVLGGSLPDMTHATRYHKEHDHSIQADTLSFHLKERVKLTGLAKLFSGLQAGLYGKVMRAKALVQTDKGPFRIDLSSGEVKMVPFNNAITESRFVVIGTGLEGSTLEKEIDTLYDNEH
jgi:G3E family GTPase